MTNATGRTIWVCFNCAAMHANGELGDDSFTPDQEPWSLLEGTQKVAAGIPEEEHECGKPLDLRDSDPCDCETREWVSTNHWDRCEGCGSTLGGSRHGHFLFE